MTGPDDAQRERRLAWSVLMRRAFRQDVLVCPRCAGEMRLVALISAGPTAQRILAHLGLSTRAPPPLPPPPAAQPSLALADDAGIDPSFAD